MAVFQSDASDCVPKWSCYLYIHQAHRRELGPAIPVQPSEPKCKNNMIYYPETVEFYTRSCNDISQLILWICLHKAHRYDFGPAIPAKSFGQKRRNQFELLLRNGWVPHKVPQWYLPTHSVDLFHKGHKYDFRPAIPAKSSEQKWRNQFEVLLGLGNGWVLHKVLQWYLPNHSVNLSSQGP